MSPLASVAARGPREETKHLKICHWPPSPLPPPSTISSLCHLNIPASVSLDARFSHGPPSGPSQSRALVPRPPPRPVPLPTPVSTSSSRMPLHCLSLHEGEEVTGRVRNLEQPPDLDLRAWRAIPSLLYPRPFPNLHNLASPPLLLLSSQPSTLVSVRFFLLLPLFIQSAGLLSLSFKQLGLSSHSLSDFALAILNPRRRRQPCYST